MQETPQQYTQRMLDLSRGKDPLRLQQAAPRKFAALAKGLSKKQLTLRPAPGKWSIAEILAHMADAELVIGYRIRLVLSSDGAVIQAYDQEAWANAFDYNHCAPKISLETFRALRDTNLRLLASVSQRLWKNYGQHSERGKESVEHMVRMVAGHDLNHIMQVEKIARDFS
jgi:hypothetical protein